VLLLELVLAPILIGGASLAARRWGPAVTGWLVGLPLTSGAVALFVAVAQGIPFAIDVGLAVLAGGFALCAYSIVYVRAASARLGPIPALAVASIVYIVAAAALGAARLPGFATPRPGGAPRAGGDAPAAAGDPGRALGSPAATLGPARPDRRRDVAHRSPDDDRAGPRAAGERPGLDLPGVRLDADVLRPSPGGIAGRRGDAPGPDLGLFGWLAFWAALLVIIPVGGVAPGFLAAIVAALAVQGLTFRVLGSSAAMAVGEVGEVVP